MSERIPNLHVGDLVRVFTYTGTIVTSGAPHTVEEDRLGDKIFNPLDERKEGLRFVGVYVGTEKMRVAMNVDIKEQIPEPYLKFQVFAQNFQRGHPHPKALYDDEGPDTPDLRIPERLIRRYQILEPLYTSDVLPLEKEVEETLVPK